MPRLASLESVATYRHVCPLASGGVGSVALALRRDGTFVRLYAIKRLHPHFRDEPDVRASFLDEARIAGLLRHPNVVSVVDVGEDDEGPFLVMEYVDGVALSDLVGRAARRNLAIPIDVSLRIAAQVARGLAAAHELTSPDGESLELVHRDVSPQNVLVSFDGTARVTDFGIAKAIGRQSQTSTGLLKGKLAYMAPEQLRFRPADARTDLFAFGIVLYELLAGRRLYSSTDAQVTAQRILEEPPPDLADDRDDVPPELHGLVFKLLAKNPEARPGDARSVAKTLDAVLAELTASGETFETGAFIEQLFHDERLQRQRLVAAAISELDAPRTIPVGGVFDLPPMDTDVELVATDEQTIPLPELEPVATEVATATQTVRAHFPWRRGRLLAMTLAAVLVAGFAGWALAAAIAPADTPNATTATAPRVQAPARVEPPAPAVFRPPIAPARSETRVQAPPPEEPAPEPIERPRSRIRRAAPMSTSAGMDVDLWGYDEAGMR